MNDSMQDRLTRRVPILLVIFAGLMVLVLGKYAYIMFYFDLDQGDTITKKPPHKKAPEPPRGKVVDVRGNLMATSVRRRSLVANPRQVTDPWQTAQTLSEILDASAPSLYKKFTKERYFVWVDRKLSENQVKELKKLDLRGITFQGEYDRVYPQNQLAAEVLGFVGVDNEGLQGIEREFDQVLRNVNKTAGEIMKTGGTKDDVPTLKLTLDQTIQHIVEEELYSVVKKEKPENATVIAIDPRNGRIRAMANWPTYNPNKFWKYETSSRRNRAVTDVFEPGSTLKPISLAIGLVNDDFSPSSNFNCKGHYYLPKAKHTIHCHANHGSLTIPEILIQSCNVGAVKATERIESTDYYTTLRDFGFGTPTGLSLPGESAGALKHPSEWSAMTQPAMAIGQGISATALQVTNALSVVVNGGELYQPRIVQSIDYPGKNGSKTVKPFKIRRVIPRSISDKMRGYMRKVVATGTGKKAEIKQYALGGKTGTAQKTNRDKGGYYQDKFLASFVGFGPYSNPELVVGVFLDNPKEHKYGGEVAAPLFKNIMKRSLRYLEKRSQYSKIVSK